MSSTIGGGFRKQVPLHDTETVEWSGNASKRAGIITLGGKLYLTDERLLWTPNRYLTIVGIDAVAISLEKLRSVGVERANSQGLLDTLFAGGMRDRLRIEDDDGRVEIWTVRSPDSVSNRIREEMPGETPSATFHE